MRSHSDLPISARGTFVGPFVYLNISSPSKASDFSDLAASWFPVWELTLMPKCGKSLYSLSLSLGPLACQRQGVSLSSSYVASSEGGVTALSNREVLSSLVQFTRQLPALGSTAHLILVFYA